MGGDARTPDIAHRAGCAVDGANFLAHQREASPCEGGEKGDDAKSLSLAEKKDVRDPESKPPVRAEEDPQKIRREFFADSDVIVMQTAVNVNADAEWDGVA